MTLTYIVMPFRREGSFAEWLQQRNSAGLLSVQDVAYFISQAADTLQYAHDNQIVHQDVKTSNFLVRTNPEDPNHPDLLLADFGIARLSSATTSVSHSIRGTPAYMAPEQWSGEPVAATDQYALAVLAYELLTGRPPFMGRQEQVMYQHFNVSPQPPSAFNPLLSKDIDSVILIALAKDPEVRFKSIAAFARALQQATHSPDIPTIVKTPHMPKSSGLHATLAINFYFFRICPDGTYQLLLYTQPGYATTTFASGASSAIHAGLGQSNVLAVLANNNHIIGYVNYQPIVDVYDSTYSQGRIGVVADNDNSSTEVVFSNAKVWTF